MVDGHRCLLFTEATTAKPALAFPVEDALYTPG